MFPYASLVLLYTPWRTCNSSGYNITWRKSLLFVNRKRQTHNEVYGLTYRFNTLIKLMFFCTSKVGRHNIANLGTSVFPAFDGRTAYGAEWKEESCVVTRLFCS
jgi:hypothetical protein